MLGTVPQPQDSRHAFISSFHRSALSHRINQHCGWAHLIYVSSENGLSQNGFSLEGKEFLVLTDQYSVQMFSCCLRLLSFCSSTFHQTNMVSAQIRSEDHLPVSRIRSNHLLLEVIVHTEEECLVFLPLGTLDQIELLVQYQSIFCHE